MLALVSVIRKTDKRKYYLMGFDSTGQPIIGRGRINALAFPKGIAQSHANRLMGMRHFWRSYLSTDIEVLTNKTQTSIDPSALAGYSVMMPAPKTRR